ncbi:hypothetical protein GCM10027176_13180 [Actinoallomurus bryophytorum]
MRIRTLLASVGLASIAAVGISAPDAHAAAWQFTGNLYAQKSSCVDDGQQYEREGYPYKCTYAYFSFTKQYLYWLYIYN